MPSWSPPDYDSEDHTSPIGFKKSPMPQQPCACASLTWPCSRPIARARAPVLLHADDLYKSMAVPPSASQAWHGMQRWHARRRSSRRYLSTGKLRPRVHRGPGRSLHQKDTAKIPPDAGHHTIESAQTCTAIQSLAFISFHIKLDESTLRAVACSCASLKNLRDKLPTPTLSSCDSLKPLHYTIRRMRSYDCSQIARLNVKYNAPEVVDNQL